MTIQRLIEFTTDATGGAEIVRAVRVAFAGLEQAQPAGVRLAYWRVGEGERFVALIELADEASNPLTTVPAAAALPRVIGDQVDGGYPVPQRVQLVGAYGFDL